MQHFHRGDGIITLNGQTFVKVSESKGTWAGFNGRFITVFRTDGEYKGVLGKSRSARSKYLKIRIGKIHGAYAHRVIFEVCSGTEIPEGSEIDHINGDPLDNRFENLRVVSCRKENMANPVTKERQRTHLRNINSNREIVIRRNKAISEAHLKRGKN